MLDATTMAALAAWVLIAWSGVDYWRQVRAVREWAGAHGLPLTPPVSRMRLARAMEALEPSMSGLWDGAWVHVSTRPAWVMTAGGVRHAYALRIRVATETPATCSVQAPARLGNVLVRDREVLIAPWGRVPLDLFAEYLSEAVAHARARTGGGQSTTEANART